ncbi:MAG: hypothetical protein CVU16_14340, partial [Betaproteobacteria bacterium HGW-Betaproteobacteria-10]
MIHKSETAFLGLAPFLRLSIAGGDLRQVAQSLLEKAGQDQDNTHLWMNLSTALFAIGQREIGLSVQAEALFTQRSYQIPSLKQPAKFRLFILMAAGDIAENTPLDCLLEGSDIDLNFYYATVDAPLPPNLPAHDALLVAMADGAANRPILKALEPLLEHWEKPVINAPQHIPNTERDTASRLLHQAPGILMPPTRQISRATLQAIANGEAFLNDQFDHGQFPIILRPVGSQAGRDLAKINDLAEMASYLATVADPAFYLAPFIDYRNADGLFRKYRIALINGQPFACHMGISSHWMIHYINAGMYEDSTKRAEEAAFMANFSAFSERHRPALAAIHQRSKLDYLAIDCAETPAGELLIFEIDHVMVIHAMDP